MATETGYSKVYPSSDIGAAMMEKYLHSKAASLLEKGRHDEAVEFFRRAIDLEIQPYTLYHLGLAHLKNNELSEAIVELSNAIKLAPGIPEYYLERSRAYQLIGDDLKAQKDRDKALALDPNYARIGAIRAGLQTVKGWLAGPAWLDGLRKKRIKSKKLRALADDHLRERDARIEALRNASCLLPCPSYCCHFGRETILHGLHIGPWKLHAIRKFFKERGLPEGEYLGKIPYEGERHLSEQIPPQFIVGEKGRSWIHYPLRQAYGLPTSMLKDIPKGNDYQSLVWINEKAWACAFLREGRCLIHDIGGESGLPSCKEFLCLTGFVFVVLGHLGLADESKIAAKNIGELNMLAVESLLFIAEELLGHKSIVKGGRKIEGLLKKAIEADRGGKERIIDELIDAYVVERDHYAHTLCERKEALRSALVKLVSG